MYNEVVVDYLKGKSIFPESLPIPYIREAFSEPTL